MNNNTEEAIMTQFHGFNSLLNKKEIRPDEIHNFFKALGCDSMYNESCEYFQSLQREDFAHEFEKMLKGR